MRRRKARRLNPVRLSLTMVVAALLAVAMWKLSAPRAVSAPAKAHHVRAARAPTLLPPHPKNPVTKTSITKPPSTLTTKAAAPTTKPATKHRTETEEEDDPPTSHPGKTGGVYPAEAIAPHTAVGSSFDWRQPTDGPYPSLDGVEDLWVDVSLAAQRVYIMNGQNILYTMITSSGLPGADTDTPPGTYHIQNRGLWFYNQKDQEGGEYWVSWKGWGNYLFHTVPMNTQKQVIPKVAAELGVPASHGCFHLTISDARWFYENIPTHTKVVVQAGLNTYATGPAGPKA